VGGSKTFIYLGTAPASNDEYITGRFDIAFEDGSHVKCLKIENGNRECETGKQKWGWELNGILFCDSDTEGLIDRWKHLTFRDDLLDVNLNCHPVCTEGCGSIYPQFPYRDTDVGCPLANVCEFEIEECLPPEVGVRFQDGINNIVRNYINNKVVAKTGHKIYGFVNGAEIPFNAKLKRICWYDDAHGKKGDYIYEADTMPDGSRTFVNGDSKEHGILYTFEKL
jgi:hypothetical protein